MTNKVPVANKVNDPDPESKKKLLIFLATGVVLFSFLLLIFSLTQNFLNNQSVLGEKTQNYSLGKVLGDSASLLAQKLALSFGDLLRLLPGEQPASESPQTTQPATGATVASSGGSDQVTVANPILPSIQGFGTDKIVGASTVSYPIAVPAGTGGLTPSLALTYSSRTVDDMHNNNRCWRTDPTDDKYVGYFNSQSSQVGLGWDLSGLGYIARDPGENTDLNIINGNLEDDRFFLVFPGGSAELINNTSYKNITPGTTAASEWRTYPDLFARIEHAHIAAGGSNCKFQVGYDTDQWIITTKDGTKYYFGNPSSDNTTVKGRLCNDDGCSTGQVFGATSESTGLTNIPKEGNYFFNKNMNGGVIADPNLATEYTVAPCTDKKHSDGTPQDHNRIVPQKWHLRKIVDVHDNVVKIKYESRIKLIHRNDYYDAWGNGWCTTGCADFYTHDVRPVRIVYGSGGLMTVNLNYVDDRADYKLSSWQWTQDPDPGDGGCKNAKNNDDRVIYSNRYWTPSFSYARLNNIEVKVSGNLVRKYSLGYAYADGGGIRNNRRLRDAMDEEDEPPPEGGINPPGTFGGHSILTSIIQYGTNGTTALPAYTFTYTDGSCTNSANCPGYGHQVYLATANNGYNGKVTFNYENTTSTTPTVCNYSDSCETDVGTLDIFGAFRKRLVSKVVEDGVGDSSTVSYLYSPARPYASVKNLNVGTDLNNQYSDALKGFKILGYDWVEEDLSAKNSGSLVTKTKSYYRNKKESSSCFKPDPRSGMEWKTELINPTDTILSFSETTILPDLSCENIVIPDPNPQGTPSNPVENNCFIRTVRADSTIGSKTTRVTYDFYDSYGNLKQTHLWGEIDTSGNNVDPGDDRYQFTNYAYNLTNWILDRPAESYLSADPAGTYKYGWTRNYYDSDGNCADPVQASFSGTKGELKATITKQDTMTPVSSAACDASPSENPSCVKASFAYDSYGNQTNAYGPKENQRSETIYDSTYHLFPVENRTYLDTSNFYHTHTAYDYTLGVPTEVRDVNDQVSSVVYDVFGRKKHVFGPSLGFGKSPETQFNYSVADTDWPYPNAGAPVSVLTQTWKDSVDIIKSVVHYNGLGQPIQSQSEWENGRTVLSNTAYNSLGKAEEVSLPYDVDSGIGSYRSPDWSKPHSNTTYDALARVLVATNPDNTSSRSEYLNWTITSFDAENLKSWLANDAFGKTKTIKAYNRDGSEYATTSNTYDLTGNLIKTTDPSGNISFACYDSLGRKYESSDLDLGKSWSRFDLAGNLAWQKDAKNQEFTFQYDLLSRPTRSNLPDGSYVVQTYDQGTNGLGRLKKSEKFLAGGTLHSSREAIGYDNLGRSYGERFSFPSQLGSTSFTTDFLLYDLLNNLVIIQYPDGEKVTNTYDSLGRLKKVIGNDTYVSDITYYPQGEIKSLTLGDAKTTNYTYNANNRRLETMSAPSVLDYSYTYDKVGNIKTWTGVASSPINFNYDHLYRLTSAAGGLAASYSYDVLSRLTAKNENTNLSPSYDANFPLHAPKNIGGAYSYDNNGNLLTDGQRTITWNVENKPSSIVLGTTTTNYDYDASGSRIYREEPGEKKVYVNQYFAKDLLSGTYEKYYFAGGKRIAQRTITTEPTPTPTPTCTVSCLHVIAYNSSWALITNWSTKVPPQTINFAVKVNTTCPGGITKARFKFVTEDEGAWRETTNQITGTVCGSGNFCFTTPITLTAAGNYELQVQVYTPEKGWQ